MFEQTFFFFFIAERYRADDVTQDSREDCYLATLHIKDADSHDTRSYYLVVENERGADRHAIKLIVDSLFTGTNQFNQNTNEFSFHCFILQILSFFIINE